MFKQGAFQIDPNATPDQIARKRELIRAMMPKYGSARYVGEGLGQLFYGIGSGRQENALDKQESAGRKSAADQFGRLFGTANSAQSPDVQGPMSVLGMTPQGPAMPPPDPNSPHALGDATMAALGKPAVKTAADPASIKAGLVARGLPDHIADGFVMNMQDESGLNPGINEAAPLVPGSRGGFGLYQLTGPRRRAFEAFAAERGLPLDDVDAQLDFMMMELQGPEKAAWETISGTQNAGEAGAAIVNNFLRPAESHRASRAAEYLGGGGMPSSGAAPAGGQGGIPMAELQMAMMNPWLMSDPAMAGVINAEYQRQAQQSDPMYQLQLQQAQLELQKAQQPEGPPEEFATRMFTLNSLKIDPQSEEGKVYLMTGELPESGAGAGGTEYGLTPQYGTDKDGNLVAIQFAKDGTSIATPLPEGVALTRGIEKLDLGDSYQFVNTMTGERIGEPVPKNLRGAESEKAIGAAEGEAAGKAITGLGGAVAQADEAIALIDSIATDPALPGITGMVQGRMPPLSQDGTDLNVKITQLQGKAFLEAFESLKGGGAITEREGQAATDAMARLNRAQSTEAYVAALNELKMIMQTGVDRARAKAGAAGGGPAADGDLGLSEDDLKYLE